MDENLSVSVSITFLHIHQKLKNFNTMGLNSFEIYGCCGARPPTVHETDVQKLEERL